MINILRDSAAETPLAHNQVIVGSNPTPALIIYRSRVGELPAAYSGSQRSGRDSSSPHPFF